MQGGPAFPRRGDRDMKRSFWRGNGFAVLAGFFALFAIGADSLAVRFVFVPLVAFAASLQGWVDGVESGRRAAPGGEG